MWEAGWALVELSVMEQRYSAVLEVEAGCPVTEVAERYGVSRQTSDAAHFPTLGPDKTYLNLAMTAWQAGREHYRQGLTGSC
jgi:hypothetical protein